MVGEAAPADLDLYIRGSGNLRRLLESVGLERRAKDVGMSLFDARRLDLAEQRAAAAADQSNDDPGAGAPAETENAPTGRRKVNKRPSNVEQPS